MANSATNTDQENQLPETEIDILADEQLNAARETIARPFQSAALNEVAALYKEQEYPRADELDDKLDQVALDIYHYLAEARKFIDATGGNGKELADYSHDIGYTLCDMLHRVDFAIEARNEIKHTPEIEALEGEIKELRIQLGQFEARDVVRKRCETQAVVKYRLFEELYYDMLDKRLRAETELEIILEEETKR